MQDTVSDERKQDIHNREYLFSGEAMYEVIRGHTVHTV